MLSKLLLAAFLAAPLCVVADDIEMLAPSAPGSARQVQPYAQKITKTIDGITFTSDYDNGSLADVTSAGTETFNCSRYVDQGERGSYVYWFRFKMEGVAGRTITLNINHSESDRPALSLDGGQTWRRVSAAEAPSSNQLVLSFGQDDDLAEIAFFDPLGMQETYEKVNAIVGASDFATTAQIGSSYLDHPLWMATITDPRFNDTNKHRVWVHSRAHAAEVTSTHLMLGWLEQATEDSETGRRLRQNVIFNIVPLLNVDGVWLGHTRWDGEGLDPEREWCSTPRPSTVKAIKAQVDGFMAGSNPIEVALNLHSTQGKPTDTFFFKHLYPSVTRDFEVIQQRYIDAFANATPLFNNLSAGSSQLSACIFIESYFWNTAGESVMALTHEGHFNRRITDNAYITGADYRELGRAQAIALIEYFDLPEVQLEPGKEMWVLK